MERLIPLLFSTLAATVLADSFETQWAGFEKDFEALNNRYMLAPKNKSTKKVSMAIIDDEAGEIASVGPTAVQSESVMPLTEEEKLGYQVSDQKVREKIMNLYQKPNVVIQQYVVPF